MQVKVVRRIAVQKWFLVGPIISEGNQQVKHLTKGGQYLIVY